MARDRRHERIAAEPDGSLLIRLGPDELVIRRRYQALSIFNDVLIGVWFLIGSLAFFDPAWEPVGVWLFVLGSAQLLIRPAIRLAHLIHLRRVPPGRWEM